MLWNDSYESGIFEIDRQNFDLVSRITEMMYYEENSIRLKQLEVFEQLVKEYFANEQRLHGKYHYFDSYSHRISHEVYISGLARIRRNFEKTGSTLENEREFFRQVFEFLKEHIMNHDKSFGEFGTLMPIGINSPRREKNPRPAELSYLPKDGEILPA